MTLKQDDIFLKKEGDQYFKRNRCGLRSSVDDHLLAYVAQSGWRPKRILDIGCSNGYKLHEFISLRPDCEGYGIEPSQLAIEDGIQRFPELKLSIGVSHDLKKFSENLFDGVLLSFVLHWVDRCKLLQTISEIDRVLTEGGLLLIKDFAPLYPCKTKYHHLNEFDVYTYKQEYWNIFLASHMYRLLYIEEFTHGQVDSLDNQQLCKFAVLEKNSNASYPLVTLEGIFL